MSRQHIQTIARSRLLTLQHLADLDAQRLAAVGARYRPVRRSTRWQEVVSDPEVDVVVVGVVPTLHPEIARAALEHGKPVYVEKPLASTAEECLGLDRLARECGLGLAVGFNRRFAPAAELLRGIFRAAAGPKSVFYRISDDDRIRPPEQAWKKGDRLLIETVHIFDFLSWLLGAEPIRVTARETRPNDAMVLLQFDDGSQASILSSADGSLEQPKEHLEAVLGPGAVEMDDFVEVRTYGLSGVPRLARFAGRAYDDCDNGHGEDFARRGLEALVELRRRYAEAAARSGVLADSADPTAWARFRVLLGDPPLPQINYASDKGWQAALERFCVAAVRGEPAPNASAVDAQRATACALAARQSIATGRPVTIDGTNRHRPGR